MRDFFSDVSGFAQDVTIRENGAERAAKAFVRPESVKNPEKPHSETPAGLRDKRRWLFMTAADAISGGEDVEIVLGSGVYAVLRCELVGGGSHWEGLMRLKGGGDHA